MDLLKCNFELGDAIKAIEQNRCVILTSTQYSATI
nr:MAG TPA: hypothetical protein [Caudoviricetes sp.]